MLSWTQQQLAFILLVQIIVKHFIMLKDNVNYNKSHSLPLKNRSNANRNQSSSRQWLLSLVLGIAWFNNVTGIYKN